MISSSKGFALMTALVISILIGLLIPSLLNVAISRSQMSFISTNGVRAQYLAEAAKQLALWQCRTGDFNNYVTAQLPADFRIAGWTTTITKSTADATGRRTITVRVDYPDA